MRIQHFEKPYPDTIKKTGFGYNPWRYRIDTTLGDTGSIQPSEKTGSGHNPLKKPDLDTTLRERKPIPDTTLQENRIQPLRKPDPVSHLR